MTPSLKIEIDQYGEFKVTLPVTLIQAASAMQAMVKNQIQNVNYIDSDDFADDEMTWVNGYFKAGQWLGIAAGYLGDHPHEVCALQVSGTVDTGLDGANVPTELPLQQRLDVALAMRALLAAAGPAA